jgi:hypothetical protein
VRLRKRHGGQADVVRLADVIEEVSVPVRLTPGHPLRGQRCLLCGQLVGGRECRLATLIDLRHGGCSCGAISTITMLICADHDGLDSVDWLDVLTGRWAMHHGKVTA